MAEDKEKVVEKHYIEVNQSTRKHFITGFLGGVGWAFGATIGTAVVAYIISILIRRVDIVPIFGQFIADVIKAAQQNLSTPR